MFTPAQYIIVLPPVVAFVTTFLLVPQVRRFALEWHVGDKPNGRKIHANAIPHLGGIAIFGGFFLALLVSLTTPYGMIHATRVLTLLPGLMILFGLGLVDDLRGVPPRVKLVYQTLGATCVVAMGASLQGTQEASPAVFGMIALSILWYVAVCNSVNLIDGLDGLAAGTSLISAIGFFAVALKLDDPATALVSAVLAAALLAFLRYNFHPARIFMGDTGSMFAGFTLAFLGCLLAERLGFWRALLGSATMLGVPILDTVTAIIRRLIARRPIFAADGEHTHHNLMRIGLSHRGSVVALYAVAVLCAVLGTQVLLGAWTWFAVAVAMGFAVASGIAIAAHGRPIVPLPSHEELESHRPTAARRAPHVPITVAPSILQVGRRERARRESEVLAELPPVAKIP